MHARGCLPYCLILVGLGCTSPRYVGSIGRDGTYSNRGYGIAVRLVDGGLSERWKAIDPSELEKAPRKHRPSMSTEPLDVDGDGYLDITERQSHTRPTLRLISKTSSTARIDLQVSILGGKNRAARLDALLALELNKRSKTASVAVAGMQKRGSSFVSELVADDGRFYRIGLIDHPDFKAEEGIRRRQVVKVTLAADAKTDQLEADHDRLLEAIILNTRGSSEGVKEKW